MTPTTDATESHQPHSTHCHCEREQEHTEGHRACAQTQTGKSRTHERISACTKAFSSCKMRPWPFSQSVQSTQSCRESVQTCFSFSSHGAHYCPLSVGVSKHILIRGCSKASLSCTRTSRSRCHIWLSDGQKVKGSGGRRRGGGGGCRDNITAPMINGDQEMASESRLCKGSKKTSSVAACLCVCVCV